MSKYFITTSRPKTKDLHFVGVGRLKVPIGTLFIKEGQSHLKNFSIFSVVINGEIFKTHFNMRRWYEDYNFEDITDKMNPQAQELIELLIGVK